MKENVMFELSFYFEPWEDFVPVGLSTTRQKAANYALAHYDTHSQYGEKLEPYEQDCLKSGYDVEYKVQIEEVPVIE